MDDLIFAAWQSDLDCELLESCTEPVNWRVGLRRRDDLFAGDIERLQ